MVMTWVYFHVEELKHALDAWEVRRWILPGWGCLCLRQAGRFVGKALGGQAKVVTWVVSQAWLLVAGLFGGCCSCCWLLELSGSLFRPVEGALLNSKLSLAVQGGCSRLSLAVEGRCSSLCAFRQLLGPG